MTTPTAFGSPPIGFGPARVLRESFVSAPCHDWVRVTLPADDIRSRLGAMRRDIGRNLRARASWSAILTLGAVFALTVYLVAFSVHLNVSSNALEYRFNEDVSRRTGEIEAINADVRSELQSSNSVAKLGTLVNGEGAEGERAGRVLVIRPVR